MKSKIVAIKTKLAANLFYYCSVKYLVCLFQLCLGLTLLSLLSCKEKQESSFLNENKRINDFETQFPINIPQVKALPGVYKNEKLESLIISGNIDQNGLKQGQWKIIDILNDLTFEDFYMDNIKYGHWKSYTPISLIFEGDFFQDKKQGIWHINFPYEQKEKYILFCNDTLSGPIQEISIKDSILLCDGNYIKGLKNGYWKIYYNNGNLKEQGHFHENNKSGWWQNYNENGTLLSKASYSRGEIAGYVKLYENGIIAKEGNMFNNKYRGTWKTYDSNGNLKKILEYGE